MVHVVRAAGGSSPR